MSVRAGEALRNAGQRQAERAADPRVILMIDRIIEDHNKDFLRQPWSANDIRSYLPACDQHLVGARVDAARKRGEMEAVGWVKSTLASTRGKPVVLWRGKAAS